MWLSVCFGMPFLSEFRSIRCWFREARLSICMVKTNTKRMSAIFGPLRKKCQNDQKIASKIIKIPLKNSKNRVDLLDVFCERFLVAFWCKTGPPGGAGGPQKSDSSCQIWNKRRFWDTFWTSLFVRVASGSILEGFRKDFERIFARFG